MTASYSRLTCSIDGGQTWDTQLDKTSHASSRPREALFAASNSSLCFAIRDRIFVFGPADSSAASHSSLQPDGDMALDNVLRSPSRLSCQDTSGYRFLGNMEQQESSALAISSMSSDGSTSGTSAEIIKNPTIAIDTAAYSNGTAALHSGNLPKPHPTATAAP